MNTKSAAFPMLVLIIAPIAILFLALECIQPVIDWFKTTELYINLYCKYYDVRYRLLQTNPEIVIRNFKFNVLTPFLANLFGGN